MFKDSSAEYYQNDLCKIRPDDEKKSLLSVEKNIIK